MSLLSNPTKRRWVGWGLLTLPYVMLIIFRNSTAVLSGELMRVFETTGAELGLLHAAFFYVYAFGQLPAGVLSDQLGARKTTAIGTSVMALGGIAFVLSQSYILAFVSRVLIGLGGSVLYVSVLRFCANWYRPTEFATMSGLTLSASAVGGILATTPLAVAITAVGWRPTIFAVSACCLILVVGVLLVAHNTPREAGLTPIDGVPDGKDAMTLTDVIRNTRTVLKDRETWIVGLMMFFITGTGTTVLGLWGIPYIVQVYDVSVTFASVFLLGSSIGMLLGSTMVGWISDHLERRVELIIAGGFVYTVAYGTIAVMVRPPLPILALAFFLPGFSFGGFGLAYTVVKERHPVSASGVATGTVNGMGFLGGALFPGIIGRILDAYWTGESVAGARVYSETGYQIGFSLITLNVALATTCALWLWWRRSDTDLSFRRPHRSADDN
jgi:sugar phosphate permease